MNGRKPFVDRSYEKDEFVQKWLVGLSERSKKNYAKEFKRWLDFIQMSPTEQIHKRIKDLTTENLTDRLFFENQFRAYKEFLERQGKYKPDTVKTLLRTVASFFTRNGLQLSLKKGDWESTQNQRATTRMKLTKEDVKALYSHAGLRDRALLLVLAQSGLSEADVNNLRIEDLKGLYENPETQHFYLEKPREKTGELQATCLSYEAMHDIKAMLQERGNPKEGFLFVSQTKAKGQKTETRTLNEAIKGLAEKAFSPDKAKDFKTKMLRSFYNSALLHAGIEGEKKDIMMGHGRQGARKAYDFDEETIKENYVKAFEFLSVNGTQVREDMKKLQETMQGQQTMIDNLSRQVQDSNKIIEDMQRTIRAVLIQQGKIKPKEE